MGQEPDPSPQVAAALNAEFMEWVEHFQIEHIDLFPPTGRILGRPLPPPPFPRDCWWLHPLLVQRLRRAMTRDKQVAGGNAKDGYRAEDLDAYVDERLLPVIHHIGRVCRNGHVDLSASEPVQEFVPSRPSLPGQPVLRPKAGPPAAVGWRAYVVRSPRPEREMGR